MMVGVIYAQTLAVISKIWLG